MWKIFNEYCHIIWTNKVTLDGWTPTLLEQKNWCKISLYFIVLKFLIHKADVTCTIEPVRHDNCTMYNAVFVFMLVVHLPCRCTFKRPRWPSLWVSVPRCPSGCSTCPRCTWFSSTRSRTCPSARVASRPWSPPPPCPTSSTPRLDSDPMGRPRRSCAKAWRRKVRTQMQMRDVFWHASGDGEQSESHYWILHVI